MIAYLEHHQVDDWSEAERTHTIENAIKHAEEWGMLLSNNDVGSVKLALRSLNRIYDLTF